MVIGLICNQDGCPIGVEVFAGNTQDASTVPDKIREVQQRYGIKKLIFVGDRGMVTQANYEKVKDWQGLWTISALTHHQILELLERKLITPEIFDERKVVEVIDPDHPKLRYCLCRNPETKAREGATRRRLLELTQIGLEKISQSKRKTDAAHLGARVGKLLAKYKMGKFVTWEVKGGKLLWSVDQKKIQAEQVWCNAAECFVVEELGR
jgi:transposase